MCDWNMGAVYIFFPDDMASAQFLLVGNADNGYKARTRRQSFYAAMPLWGLAVHESKKYSETKPEAKTVMKASIMSKIMYCATTNRPSDRLVVTISGEKAGLT